MYCLRKTSYMWHADHIIIYYHMINQLFLGGTSPKVVVSCTKNPWEIVGGYTLNPWPGVRVWPRVEKADPYPYPSVPYPKPMRVFKPLTITSATATSVDAVALGSTMEHYGASIRCYGIYQSLLMRVYPYPCPTLGIIASTASGIFNSCFLASETIFAMSYSFPFPIHSNSMNGEAMR